MNKTPLLVVALLATFLAGCGRQDSDKSAGSAPAAPPSAAAPAPAAPPPAAAPAPVANAVGESVYKKTCAMCHAAAVAGSPKPGDKADWGPRIAQGRDVLYKHAPRGSCQSALPMSWT